MRFVNQKGIATEMTEKDILTALDRLNAEGDYAVKLCMAHDERAFSNCKFLYVLEKYYPLYAISIATLANSTKDYKELGTLVCESYIKAFQGLSDFYKANKS